MLDHPHPPPPLIDGADKALPVQPFVWLVELGFSDGERVWRMKLSDEGWSVKSPGQVGRGRLSAVPPGLPHRYRWMLRSWQALRVAVREKAAQRKQRMVWNVDTANHEWLALTAGSPWLYSAFLRVVADETGELVLVAMAKQSRRLPPFELPWGQLINGDFEPSGVAKEFLASIYETGVENIRRLLRVKKQRPFLPYQPDSTGPTLVEASSREGHMPATQLRHRRIDLGLTQREIWAPAGVSAGRYSLIERGLSAPTAQEASRISRVVRLPPDRLFPQPLARPEGTPSGGKMDREAAGSA